MSNRTVMGLILTIYGWMVWYLTLGFGCRWFIRDQSGATTLGRVGGWLIEQYGWARNQEWQ